MEVLKFDFFGTKWDPQCFDLHTTFTSPPTPSRRRAGAGLSASGIRLSSRCGIRLSFRRLEFDSLFASQAGVPEIPNQNPRRGREGGRSVFRVTRPEVSGARPCPVTLRAGMRHRCILATSRILSPLGHISRLERKKSAQKEGSSTRVGHARVSHSSTINPPEEGLASGSFFLFLTFGRRSKPLNH